METRGLVLLLAITFVSCGHDMTPQEARAELGRLNVSYSEASFIESAKNGDILAVDLFLRAGMDINARDSVGRLAWQFATDTKNPLAHTIEFQESLNQVGVSLGLGEDHTSASTALMAAAVAGRAEVIKLLLTRGAEVESIDRVDMTALMYAAWQGQTEATRALINAGANRSYHANKLKSTVTEAALGSQNPDTISLIGHSQ